MNRLLKIGELSELLQVSKKTIYGWVHDNYIPYFKLGGAVRFREKDIEVWLNKRMRQGRTRRRIEID